MAERDRSPEELEARARAMGVLTKAAVPFVVGGAYCHAHYTGIYRDTKDLDLFPRRKDAGRALEILAADGWRTERADEVWIYKAYRGEFFVDLIFSSGNGVAEVDDLWFEHAQRGFVFGQWASIAPAEEMIWSKAFVQERERWDGADVAHLLRATARNLDWARLLWRFSRYWEVLLAHVLLFRFIYPSERDAVPDWAMAHLLGRAEASVVEGPWRSRVCRGPLLSKVNYGVDLSAWGYRDGRLWDERDREEASRDATRPQYEAEDRGGR